MDLEYKATPTIGLAVDPDTGIFTAFPSVFGVRDLVSDIVHPGAFAKTLRERKSPLKVFFNHQAAGLPVGKTLDAYEVDRAGLPADILDRWPEATGGLFTRVKVSDTSQGRDLLALLRDNVLGEMSIGYMPVPGKFDVEVMDGQRTRHLRELKLAEISVVNYPALPAALITGVKAALPYRKTPLADMGMAWDAAYQTARADVDDLRAMCAWIDPDDTDEDGAPRKSAFKLPHHTAESGHPVVWRGVAAAMSRLLQKAVDLPDADREGVHAHLAGHFEDFGKTAPALKDYAAEGYSLKQIDLLCGVEAEQADPADELKAIDELMTRLEARRRVLVPRPSVQAVELRLRMLSMALQDVA